MTDSKTDRAPAPGVPQKEARSRSSSASAKNQKKKNELQKDETHRIRTEDPAAMGPGFDDGDPESS